MAKILLAEDEVNIASFIERGLKEFRHSVTVCHDGNTGWRILQEEPIIRKTKCSPLFKRSDISYKTKRPPKNNFPKYSRGSKKSTGKFCFSQCFFL